MLSGLSMSSCYEEMIILVRLLRDKVIRIINNVPVQDYITPRYITINLSLLKFPDIVKLHTSGNTNKYNLYPLWLINTTTLYS